MPRKDIEFKTIDHVTLRGWFYTPEAASGKLPCLVMAHGWSALKEMDLDSFAEFFVKKLPIACLVYDHRGFGASDTKEGAPPREIDPHLQRSDYSDAITYAQTLPQVNPEKIGIWGSSYSGGHVLYVGAVDRRVKAVLSQAPMTDGWTIFHRLTRTDFIKPTLKMFNEDRHARMAGQEPGRLPVVDPDPMKPSALPTADSYQFFSAWEKKSNWKNDVTVRSVDLLRGNDPSHMIHRISPTPLLMTVVENDELVATDASIESFQKAREPKELHILPGGHFDAYTGFNFERNAGKQAEFLHRHLCADQQFEVVSH